MKDFWSHQVNNVTVEIWKLNETAQLIPVQSMHLSVRWTRIHNVACVSHTENINYAQAK